MSSNFCIHCGTPIVAGNTFCGQCGVRLGGTPVAQSTAVGDPDISAPTIQQPMPSYAPPPMPTTPIAVASQQTVLGFTMRQLTMIGWIAAGAIVIASAGFFFWALGRGSGDLLASVPVGPAGATVPFGDGGQVTVPPGALAKPETIIIHRTIIRKPVQLTGPTGLIVLPAGTVPVYVFGPAGLVFLRPVAVLLPVPIGARGVQIFSLSNGRLVFVAARTVNGRNTVAITMSSFGANSSIVVRA